MKTKAVTNKKIYDNYLKYDVTTDTKPNVILGSWVINHDFKSKRNNEDLEIKGEYEINIWYAYADNTKTDVVTKKIEYNEIVPKLFNETSTYSIKILGNPSCNKVDIEDDVIIIEIFKQFEIEVIDEIEIKIIENKPKKIEKIKFPENWNEHRDMTFEEFRKAYKINFKITVNTINELIDQVNYLREKSDKE